MATQFSITQASMQERNLNLRQIEPDQLASSKNICRICLSSEKQTQQQLIVPCRCAGSLQYVHKSCYYLWIKHLYDRLENQQDKRKMENQGFQCEICKANIRVYFQLRRQLVTRRQFAKICRNTVPLAITIIVFFMIALAAFSYLVYFADMTKQQFEKKNISEALFTIIGIIVVIIFFGAGIFIFVTKYLWIEKVVILGLKSQQINK